MTVGRLILRALVGGLFVGHGAQKLFGWFGGGGPGKTGESFESAGMAPGRRNALAAGTAEAAGGVLLAAGLATPAAASLLSGVMVTAIRTVHWDKGIWVTNGGYEYPAVLLASLFALTEGGPGRPSVDEALGLKHRGLFWAVAQLAAALVASEILVRMGRNHSVAAVEPSVQEEPERLRPAA